jgi:hypothetical protein
VRVRSRLKEFVLMTNDLHLLVAPSIAHGTLLRSPRKQSGHLQPNRDAHPECRRDIDQGIEGKA